MKGPTYNGKLSCAIFSMSWQSSPFRHTIKGYLEGCNYGKAANMGLLERRGNIDVFRNEIDKMILMATQAPNLPESQEILAAFRMLDRIARSEGVDFYEMAALMSARISVEKKAAEWLKNRSTDAA